MGTLAWICLLLSMLCSHEVMLRCQRAQSDPTNTRCTKSSSYYFYSATAVCLRRIGKFLAVLNALWLVASSLMEFIGLYDNCWCSGTVPGHGHNGWIVLFKNKQDSRNSAIGPWIGGTAITFLTCAVACIGFNLGCWGTGPQQSTKPANSNHHQGFGLKSQ